MKNDLSFVLRASFFVIFSTVVLSSTVVGAESTKSKLLQITRVGLSRKSFNPSKDGNVSLNFEVTQKANVKVIIYDCLGRTARTFNLGKVDAGRHSVSWDGRTADGELAQGKVFLYVIEAQGKNGSKITYNRADVSAGVAVEALGYTLDQEMGWVEYVLPKACMVRIRAGLRDGMFGNLVLDWIPQVGGRHRFKWDGMDKTGCMNLLFHSVI